MASSDSVHFVKEGGGASNVLLVGESARLVLQGSEAFALVSKQEGALELQGVNPGSQLAETIWSTDHVFVQDFVVNGSTWLSDYTGTVSAHHLKSYSAVLGYISMTASKIWSHNPEEEMSIISAADIFIGSSAA